MSVFVLLAILSFTPVAPSPYDFDTLHQFAGPSWAHLMGTDQFGRDVFSRVMHGSRIALEMIVPACLLAMIVGSTLGIIAGYFGVLADNLVMRTVDIFFAFPPVLLALAIIAVLAAGEGQLIGALAIVYTPMFVRVVRAPVLELREREYVKASLVSGASSLWVIRRQLLGGIVSVVLVQVTLTLSWMLLTETALSFLGLGLQPPTPDLGTMLSEGSQFVTLSPWLGIFPGVVITLAAVGFNLVGDGLRDALDPAMRRAQEASVR